MKDLIVGLELGCYVPEIVSPSNAIYGMLSFPSFRISLLMPRIC